MKTTITFEVSNDKTEVIAIGSKGNVDRIDITGHGIEKDLTVFLKKLQNFKLEMQIKECLDINNYI